MAYGLTMSIEGTSLTLPWDITLPGKASNVNMTCLKRQCRVNRQFKFSETRFETRTFCNHLKHNNLIPCQFTTISKIPNPSANGSGAKKRISSTLNIVPAMFLLYVCVCVKAYERNNQYHKAEYRYICIDHQQEYAYM